MEFNSGMLGVAIVVLGLIASCLFGVVMNVNQEDVLKDTDKYVTDVTGLYSTSAKDKTYTEYIPAKNYNGYTSSNDSTYAVEFTKSSTGNNYSFEYDGIHPITVERNFKTEGIKNTEGSSYIFEYGSERVETNHPYRIIADLQTGTTRTVDSPAFQTQEVYERKMSSLYELYKGANPYPTGSEYTTSISITIEYHIDSITESYSAPPPLLLSASTTNLIPSTGLMIVPTDYFSWGDEYPGVNQKHTWSQQRYNYSDLSACGYGNTLTYTCTFNSDGSKFSVTAYHPSIGNKPILTNVSSSNYMLIGSHYYGTGVSYLSQYDAENTENYTTIIDKRTTTYGPYGENYGYKVTYVYDRYVAYLDPRYGVTIRGGEDVTWENGYENGELDFVAYLGTTNRDSNGDYTIYGIDSDHQDTDKEAIWRFSDTKGNHCSLKMTHTAYGSTTLCTQYYNSYTPLGQSPNPTYVDNPSVDLGTQWIAYRIHLDFLNGKAYAQAISPEGWNSFTDWTTDQPEIEIGDFRTYTNEIVDEHPTNEGIWVINSEPMTSMQVISPSDITHSITMQVTNTMVFLNTYGVIMIDPHVNILNWYPNNEHFKMKFTKIASMGDSITIGGQTYAISEGNLITSDGSVTLTEFEIEFKKDGDTFDVEIASLKNNTHVEIDNVSDTEVWLNGVWYFNAGYYTVEEEWVKEYAWNVADGIAYGYTGVILFMMIFMGIITIAWWKIQPGTLTFFDIAIIIGVEILLFLLLG